MGGGPLVKGMRFFAPHMNLLSHWEIDPVIHFTELLDLVLCARLLSTEVVRGHSQNHESLFAVARPQISKRGILRRKTALGCRVHYEHGFACELSEREWITLDCYKAEIVGARHAALRRLNRAGKQRTQRYE